MIKFFIRLVAFSFIFILMLYVSVEAGKYTRDRARLSNIETLSKSIQFYNITYGYYPQSGLDNNVSVLLHDEQIVYGQIRDPLFLSSTVDLNNIINTAYKSYEKISRQTNSDTIRTYFNRAKLGLLSYFNLTYDSIDTLSVITDDTTLSSPSASDTLINPISDDLITYSPDCVITYSSNSETGSYELSVCLESGFFRSKKKWDGGNDDSRYEIGNDLRLNTSVYIDVNNKITSSENTSIIK